MATDACRPGDGARTLDCRPQPMAAGALVMRRRRLAGSLIGGIRETREMLDYCAGHGIASDIELIDNDQVNEAHERLLKGDVRYRFVIDTATLAASDA